MSLGCVQSREEGEVLQFVLIGWSKRIFTSGRFDNFLVSSRTPSGLHQVDSALGGSIGRDVMLGGGGGGSLVERGGIFWMGAEIPSSTRADCGVRGWFFSLGNRKLAILVTLSHAQVKPTCDYVAKSVASWYEHREIVPTGGKF